MAETPHKILSDEEYQRSSTWYSFTGTLYAALGSAAFIGLLGKFVEMMVQATSIVPAQTLAMQPVMTTGTYLAMGGLMAGGAIFTYLAQEEWTKLACIREDSLARKNAECLSRAQHHEINSPVPQQGTPEKTTDAISCAAKSAALMQADDPAIPSPEVIVSAVSGNNPRLTQQK